MILALVLFWGVMLTMTLVATVISIVHFSRPDGQVDCNQWQPAVGYAWEKSG